MTYYLKYRPQKLEEIDLAGVRETLTKIIKSKNIPHAFLFSGPKGSGKTSAARIIAKVVNCESKSANLRGAGKFEPCNKCKQCLSITNGSNIDVIELDAASHRGIDDIRTLRDAVKLVPAYAKKKIYVIDEAHMLTLEASNALLKTLEEPPNHVIFMLATTNPEKLIETIRSRTVNLIFKKATQDEITRALKRVAKGEKLKPEKGALNIIATASDGSFRDAVKILDQLVAEKKPLKKEVVEEYLYQQKVFNIDKFLKTITAKDAKGALTEIESAMGKGASSQKMTEAILDRLRKSLLFRLGLGKEDFVKIEKKELISLIKIFTKASVEISPSVIEQLPLEIAVIEWCEGKPRANNSLRVGPEAKLKESQNTEREDTADVQQSKSTIKTKSKNIKAAKVPSSKPAIENEVTEELWLRILTQIRPKNTSTEALLRAAKPINYDGNTLEIGVFYKFHKERLESNQHRILLEDVVSEILGNGTRVICTLAEQLREPRPVQTEDNDSNSEVSLTDSEDEDIIKVAKDIFGS